MLKNMDPRLAKFIIVVLSACITYFAPNLGLGELGIDVDGIGRLLGGLGIGGALLARPGDVKKASVFVLALCFASSTSACGVLDGVKVDWPSMVQCGSAAYDVAPTVSRILVEDGYDLRLSPANKSELSKLALDFGVDVVTCAIRRLTEAWRAPGKSQTPELIAAANRGDDFLAEVGVTEVHLE